MKIINETTVDDECCTIVGSNHRSTAQIPSARTKKPAEGKHLIEASIIVFIICILGLDVVGWMKNYNSKREDLEEEDQRQDERNVIL